MCDFSKYVVKDNITIREALIALNNLTNDVLVLFVVDGQDHLVGSLTDGDIRRKLIDGVNISEKVSVVMNSNFRFVYENAFCVETLKELKATGITLLPILTEDKKIVKVYNLKKKKSILPLDAVLMAGGKGERLRPLTEQIPKPLLKVGDKAIIDYNIDNLISYGVSHINVTVNYLGEQLERHFEQLREGVKVNCIREPQYLGTIGSIKFIDTFYNDTILLMNSDLFTNINFEDFFLHFLQNEADMSVAAIPYSVSVPYGIFELEERTIKGVREKPTYNYYANSGIYLIKRELLSLIPEGVFFNATDFMEKLIGEGYHVIRFPLVGYWIDIGKHEDYRKAQEFVKHL
ncbi:nucleotidyltransferase family protein [Sanguibacteroides justesenii]|uniref:Nucleotidyltransferase n=1 Tax=Sanguibacteroides justesenii TaxID=1547597 RepID=A0AB34R4Z2_9PORP|nr:nucleotidyltransferase family protein [Sanguibacteroides justesenii]KIO46926.1 nucleotidyltransferase [Sanguibacteroides justesenii]